VTVAEMELASAQTFFTNVTATLDLWEDSAISLQLSLLKFKQNTIKP